MTGAEIQFLDEREREIVQIWMMFCVLQGKFMVATIIITIINNHHIELIYA